MSHIEGSVATGFGKVADAFASNFDHHGEVGAAFCLYLDGAPVIDVWGGVADRTDGRPYTGDTLQMVFSTTKGATALCAAILLERGQLDVEAPVAAYWPQFAANGKGEIPVRWILSHQAGLPLVDAPLTFDDVLAGTPVVEALAAQAPMWDPGTAHGYHGITYGWLVGEVVRRVTGRRLSTWFADEVAAPLGLDFWIGLPAIEEHRIAPLIAALPPKDPEVAAFLSEVMGPGTLGFRALTLDGAFGGEGDAWMNTRALHAAEMPAVNGITTARSLARMYASCVSTVDGVRLLQPATVATVSENQTSGVDRCLAVETRFGLGFGLDSRVMPLLTTSSFGHAGAGGSLGFADPEHRIGFGYAMNQMASGLATDPRALNLIDAIRAALD